MLLLSQERILRDLKKKYAHYIAQIEPDFSKLDKKDAFYALTFYHLSMQVNQAINEFEDSQPSERSMLTSSSIIHLLSAINGDILKCMDEENPKYADRVLHNALKLTIKSRGKINE